MTTSPSSRRIALAAVGGLAALVFSLGTPAFADHGERHASEQGQAASTAHSRSQSSANAQNDEAAARRDAAADGGGQAAAAGNGDTQGASPSNPDGGGLDKPGCETTAEGCQGTSDFDGNNGCGNDADREDDNNGNCGGPKKPKDCPPNNAANNGRGADNANARSRIRDCGGTPPATGDNPPAGTEVTPTTGTNQTTGTDTGNVLSAVAATETTGSAALEAGGATVLGVSFERAAEAAQVAPTGTEGKAQVLGVHFERGQLARTGFGVLLVALVGLGLLGAGTGLRRLAHRR